MKRATWSLVVVALMLCAGVATRARAYCRTTTEKHPADTCDGHCSTLGFPLAWPHASLVYSLSERGFPGLDDSTLRAALADVFGQWQAVVCDGQPVGLELGAASETTALEVRPDTESPSTSVVGHLGPEEWSDHDFDPFAFALTRVRAEASSGRIVGADMWFNGGLGTFTICPDEGCNAAGDVVDLPNVATHEAGHFLGLAHRHVQGATMSCNADTLDTNKRTLEPDDRAGLCAIYPPGIAFASEYLKGEWALPEPRGQAGSCGIAAARSESASGWPGRASLLLLAAYQTYRRRAHQAGRRGSKRETATSERLNSSMKSAA